MENIRKWLFGQRPDVLYSTFPPFGKFAPELYRVFRVLLPAQLREDEQQQGGQARPHQERTDAS